jgi:hypothetical protein
MIKPQQDLPPPPAIGDDFAMVFSHLGSLFGSHVGILRSSRNLSLESEQPEFGLSVVQPVTEVRVPDNQLQLSEAELDEEIAKMLTANNPEAPKAPVQFIQKERAYKPEAMVTQTVTHYATDGWLLHQDSEDAKKQLDQHKVEEEMQRKFMAEVKAVTDSAGGLTHNSSMLSCGDYNFQCMAT